MNPSMASATVLVDELVRGGVREVVLCPGSRSAPIAYAVQAAERAGRLRLHVRVDERGAGFLALGLMIAAGGARAVAVVTTSGTAVANLHPAVLEAHHSGWPLLVVSADRPHELRGTGANQTTEQPGIFGPATRYAVDLPAASADLAAASAASWRSTVCRALAAAHGTVGPGPGPVHLNVCFREPLAPDLDEPADETADHPAAQRTPPSNALQGRPDDRPWVELLPDRRRLDTSPGARVPHLERTVVVVGGGLGTAAAGAAVDWARRRGYPVIAEPFGSYDRTAVVPHGPLLLTAADWLDAHAPERVLVVGRVTLARPVAALLRRPDLVVERLGVGPEGQWPDPSHVVSRIHPWSALAAEDVGTEDVAAEDVGTEDVAAEDVGTEDVAPGDAGTTEDVGTEDVAAEDVAAEDVAPGDAGTTEDVAPGDAGTTEDRPARLASRGGFVDQWRQAGQRIADAVAAQGFPWPTGLAVADVLGRALPATCELFVGASNPVRDLDLAFRRGSDPHAGVVVHANRGLAGIDGSVSTAVGLALGGARPAYAWLGDLTLLHDAGGLAIGPHEPGPDLTIVVTNDDGGGIFSTLEHGEPARAPDVERILGTPTGTDLAALCRAHGVRHVRAATRDDLVAAVSGEPDGLTVVEVRVDRSSHRETHGALRALVASVLANGAAAQGD